MQIPVAGVIAGYAILVAALCAAGALALRFAGERRRLGAESEQRFERARDMICIAGPDGRVRRVNPAFEEALGYRGEELAGRRFADLVHPEDGKRAEADVAAVPTGGAPVGFENRWLDRGGDAHYLEWTVSRVPGRGLLYCIARDVTDRRELELEVEALSQRDQLTGVYNRSRFDEELSARIVDARRHARGGALLLIDLDRFKRVNDEHGRAAGDAALREVARVLDVNTRGSDSVGRDADGMVARLGGDEFAVLLAEVGPVEAATIGERLVAALEDIDLTFAGSEVSLAVSVGVAPFDGRPGVGAEELLASADQAMYVVKASGGGAAAEAS